MKQIGDAPIEAEYRRTMNQVAAGIDRAFNGPLIGPKKKVGFVLLTFEYDKVGESRCNFITNGADSNDLVALFKQMIARFEDREKLLGLKQ